MKIVILKEFYLENKYKPCCGTCKYRGNVSTVWDPTEPDNTRVVQMSCTNPNTVNNDVGYYDICDLFDPANDTLKRIFLTKRLL